MDVEATSEHNFDCKAVLTSLKDSCRVCMTWSLNMSCIFDTEKENIIHEIQFCTGVTITPEADLPSQICESCLQNLSVAYKFKTTCLLADETFHKLAVAPSIKAEEPELSNIEYEYEQIEYIDDETADEYDEDIKKEIRREPENEIKLEPNGVRKSSCVKVKERAAALRAVVPPPDTSLSSASPPPEPRPPVTPAPPPPDSSRSSVSPAPERQSPVTPVLLPPDSSLSSASSPPKPRSPVTPDWSPDDASSSSDEYVSPPTSPTPARRQGRGRRVQRLTWTSQLNENVMRAYYRATDGGANFTDYRARMLSMFETLEPAVKVSAQRLATQVRAIQSFHRLDKATLDKLRLEALGDYVFTPSQTAVQPPATKKISRPIGICEICGKTFKHRESQYQHVRLHQPPKYWCDQCDYKTSRKTSLVYHIRTHTGVKSYPCEQCTASFYNSSSRIVHMRRMHMGKGTHECTTCQKKFFNKTALNRHLDTHFKIKRYKCGICHGHFSSGCWLKKHLLRLHGIVTPRQMSGSQKISLADNLSSSKQNVIGEYYAKEGGKSKNEKL